MPHRLGPSICLIYLLGMGLGPAQNPAAATPYPWQFEPDQAGQEHVPHAAFDFIDSIGINTHIDATTTSYNDIDLVTTSLKYVGIHYVREDAFEGGRPFDVSRFLRLVEAGAKIDLNGGYGDTIDLIPIELQAAHDLEVASPGSVCGLEGYNEVDTTKHHLTYNGKVVDSPKREYQAAADTQEHLWDLAHADPVLSKIPVLPFSMAWASRSVYVPDVSAWADYANVHAYAVNGGPPSRPLAAQITGTKQVAGKPVIMTETGYPTIYPGSPKLKNLVDEQVQEMFLLDTLFDNFSNKVVRTYLYELQDRRANFGDTTDQAHYGIFRYNGDAKPAATALRNLIKIMDDGSKDASGTTLAPLTFSVSEDYPDQDARTKNHYLLLQKASGVYDIVIWCEPRIWDPKTFTLIPRTSTDDVTVNFPRVCEKLDVYDPTQSDTSTHTETGTDRIRVGIVDHPIIIEVTP